MTGVCGRYEIDLDLPNVVAKLRRQYGITIDHAGTRDAHPGTMQPVFALVHGEPQAREMYWGLKPSWARRLLINARAETLAEKRMFRKLLEERRCVVPMTGFPEGRPEPAGTGRAWYSVRGEDPVFSVAGLWTTQPDRDGQAIDAFTIVTVAANSIVAPVHDRMPAMLGADAERTWLYLDSSPDTLRDVLEPYPEHRMVVTPDSKRPTATAGNSR